jgi:hypothetical protein
MRSKHEVCNGVCINYGNGLKLRTKFFATCPFVRALLDLDSWSQKIFISFHLPGPDPARVRRQLHVRKILGGGNVHVGENAIAVDTECYTHTESGNPSLKLSEHNTGLLCSPWYSKCNPHTDSEPTNEQAVSTNLRYPVLAHWFTVLWGSH